jgi:hypothetical protein
MRVHGRSYTKKSSFRYNRVVQATIITKGKVIGSLRTLIENKSKIVSIEG